MNKKTTRLSSIALALMMVLMVALTLVPIGAAGAASGSGGIEIELGTTTSSKLDAKYAISMTDGQEGIRLVATSVLWNDDKSYSNVTMQLVDPNETVIDIPGVTGTNKKKVSMTKYPGRDGDYYYDFDIDPGDLTVSGLYSVIFQRTDSGWMDEGFEVGAFWLYDVPTDVLDASGDHEFEETATAAGHIWITVGEETYAKPEAKFTLTTDLDSSASDVTVKFFGYKGFISEKKKQAGGAAVTANYTLSASAKHLDEFDNIAVAIDTSNDNDRASGTCEGIALIPTGGNAGDPTTVIVDAKGPEVGEVYLSNDKLKGILWKNAYMLATSGSTPGGDKNYIEVKSIEDDDSGLDIATPDVGYVLFKNKYHESLNYGDDTDTPFVAFAAGPYATDKGFSDGYELELTSAIYAELLDKEFDVVIVAYDQVGNKTEKNLGNVKFYDDYVQIDALRVEAQNVLEMYVGQTLTKDDIAMRNVTVWTDGNTDSPSFPDNWYWYVKLASANLLDFDATNMTITAKKAGEGYIYATPFANYDSETFSTLPEDYLKVVITDQPTVKSISLNNTTATIKAGATQQLTATVDPSGVAVTWETSNKAIATVDANGLVTGVADGTAVIYAKAGAQVALCTVTVQGDVVATGISLNKTANTMVVGASETLFATTTPAGAPVTWNTSNAAVATVDNAGKVTAMTAGTATITATSGSYSATCVVTVEGIAETLEPNQWYTDDMGNIYYSNEHSQLTVGWKKIGGYWYLFDYSTAVMKKGWAKDAGTWYYLQSDGKMKTGWLKDGSTWYYLQASGAMKTGWLKDGGVWYYLKDSGAMATGWVKVSGIWYYLQGSGAMKEGWLLESGVWYYLTPSSGAMLANGTYTVEGRNSQFAASGRWLGYV